MRKIPAKLLQQVLADPRNKVCARRNSECAGRITLEHALIYAGRQVNEAWAIIGLCVYHHLGPGLDKRENQRIAMARATEEDLKKYPQLRRHLGKL